MKRFIELNHTLENGMKPYPGLPRPTIGAILDHEASRSRYNSKAEFFLGKVDIPCNVGTYIDSPFHRFPDGADLDQISLHMVAGLPGIVFNAFVSPSRSITLNRSNLNINRKAVLIRTGWDQQWGTEQYWEPGPYLARSLVDFLVDAKPRLVGVDFWNVDNTLDPTRPAHTQLLASNILIVENLCNLSELPSQGFTFYAVPLRIVRGASFPVRAFAEIEE